MFEIKSNNHNVLMRWMLIVILIEYLTFVFSGVSFCGLHDATYFNVFTDPVYWFFFISGLPQFIKSHATAGVVADIFIVSVLIMAFVKKNNIQFIRIAFLLLVLFYVTLTAYLGHRNYQSGFVIMLFPFLFSDEKNRCFAMEGVRYFYLFFYFSSGLFKIIHHGWEFQDHLPNILHTQSIPYYLESNTDWRITCQHYLSVHQETSYFLYLSALLLEFSFIIGFFTKRADRILGVFILCFHVFNWILMDISPIGHLTVILFFFRKNITD